MEVAHMLHNGSLNSTRSMLCESETLFVGVKTLEEAEGSIEERLVLAITAMIESRKMVDRITEDGYRADRTRRRPRELHGSPAQALS